MANNSPFWCFADPAIKLRVVVRHKVKYGSNPYMIYPQPFLFVQSWFPLWSLVVFFCGCLMHYITTIISLFWRQNIRWVFSNVFLNINILLYLNNVGGVLFSFFLETYLSRTTIIFIKNVHTPVYPSVNINLLHFGLIASFTESKFYHTGYS